MEGLETQVLSSAENFISMFAKRASWVNTMISNPPEEEDEEYAKLMYIDMIKSIVSGVVFGEREKSVQPALGQQKNNAYTFNVEKRKQGLDWAYIGDTMTGFARLDNVRDLLTHVIKDNIQGGYIGKYTVNFWCYIRCNN